MHRAPIIAIACLAGLPAAAQEITADTFETARGGVLTMRPSTDPAYFVGCVDNPWFPLVPGTVWHYEESEEGETMTVTVSVLAETRQVAGIAATVVHDIVEQDGETVEDTMDWYAQDDRGNVWYLGEETAEYEDGEIVSREGSWEAGVDGAQPGIVMPGDPRVGDLYYQEYEAGEAEDMGAISATGASVEVPFGKWDDALVTADYNPLDPSLETKWYAKGIGVVRVEAAEGDSTELLVGIDRDPDQTDPERDCAIEVPAE